MTGLFVTLVLVLAMLAGCSTATYWEPQRDNKIISDPVFPDPPSGTWRPRDLPQHWSDELKPSVGSK